METSIETLLFEKSMTNNRKCDAKITLVSGMSKTRQCIKEENFSDRKENITLEN